MASSLIRINEATFEELQQLPGIGPKRAQRIMHHREQLTPLADYRDLATAAGISEAAAREISAGVDWSSERRPKTANAIFAACGVIAAVAVYDYAVRGYHAAGAGPAATLYVIGTLQILLGSLALIARQLLTNLDIPWRWRDRPVPGPIGAGWVALACLVSGLLLLTSVVIALWFMGRHDTFALHAVATLELALFVMAILSLSFGPGWYMRADQNHFAAAARLFDNSQPVLAAMVLALVTLRQRPTVIELLFAVWIGVTLLANSREMALGRSSCVNLLPAREKARLTSLVGAGAPAPHEIGTGRLTRPAGILLAILSVALIAMTLRATILRI